MLLQLLYLVPQDRGALEILCFNGLLEQALFLLQRGLLHGYDLVVGVGDPQGRAAGDLPLVLGRAVDALWMMGSSWPRKVW